MKDLTNPSVVRFLLVPSDIKVKGRRDRPDVSKQLGSTNIHGFHSVSLGKNYFAFIVILLVAVK